MLPKPNPTVIYCAMPDGGVLLSVTDESYFGLNETAACIWENLAAVRRDVDELCTEVGRRFPDVPSERIRQDVDALLAALAESGLVISS